MHLLIWLFIGQALLGLGLFEWAWKWTERHRNVVEERDSLFPAYRRMDVQLWRKWKFYPGAILWLVSRLTLTICALSFILIANAVLYFGCDVSQPLSGIRRYLWCESYNLVVWTLTRLFGYHKQTVYHTQKDVDDLYAKYLGKDWIQHQKIANDIRKKKGVKRTAAIVCNHISMLDILLLFEGTVPSFTPAKFVKDLPIADHLIRCMQSIYIDRDASLEDRELLVKEISSRLEIIETSEKQFGPIVFFAEGSVTNGSVISKFRRGAFTPEKPVTPMFIEYEYYMVSPSYDCILGFQLAILMMSTSFLCKQVCRLHVFPDFAPNEYLWQTYGKSHSERWEVFAWAVKDFFQTKFDLPENPQPLKEKVSYQKFLWGLKNEITVDGKTFKWPHSSKKDR